MRQGMCWEWSPRPLCPLDDTQLNVHARQEDNQVFICGFVELEDDTSFSSLVYIVLRAVYPALSQDDIRGVRVVARWVSGEQSSILVTLSNGEPVGLVSLM